MTQFLSNMKIGARLGGAFALVFLLVASLTITAYVQLSGVYANLRLLTESTVPTLQAIAVMDAAATRARRYNLIHVLAESEEQKRAADKTLASETEKFDRAYEKYARDLVADEHDRQNLAAVASAWHSYLAAWDETRTISNAGLSDRSAFERARTEITTSLSGTFRKVSEALDAMRAYDQGLADQAATQARSSFARARVIFAAGSGAILAALVALGVVITRSLIVPLASALRAANAIASGDLTAPITVDGRDELSELMAAMAEMQTNLERLIGEIRASVESVTGASREIAAGNQDLSARTEAQASSLEQTAASMEELTVAVKRTFESSQSANELAMATTQIAYEGSAAVERVVATMAEISTASKRISEIIGVINEIAFQTNMLALNAAVEAARAGEQGRGFAVVAAEVRSLARRAAGAAREIEDLIQTSVARVATGVDLVEDAGKKMTKIVQSVRGVSALVEEISVASREQASGIDQINVAVTQLDGATQQNAALVEESAAAATSLNDQARALSAVVGGFRTTPRIDAQEH
jgi:methyl-accepting chemotaxis protein